MNIAEHIKKSFDTPNMVVMGYLGDLSDEDLMKRPVEGTNHIKWQLGHLIAAEHQMIASIAPDAMPPLPDGFAEKHKKDTAASDNDADFYSKEDYLKLMQEQRAGTLAALAKMSDDDLAKPAPESLQQIASTVGTLFSAQVFHWMMHAGQWAVLRRKLGREPLF